MLRFLKLQLPLWLDLFAFSHYDNNTVGGTRVINDVILYQILFCLADFNCIYLDENEGGHFSCRSCCDGHGDLDNSTIALDGSGPK